MTTPTPTPTELARLLEAATDRPNPPASKRARELLADSCDNPAGSYAQLIRAGDFAGVKIDPETALRAIDTATSTLLDEIEARVRGLKRGQVPAGRLGDAVERRNTILDEILAAIASIQGRE